MSKKTSNITFGSKSYAFPFYWTTVSPIMLFHSVTKKGYTFAPKQILKIVGIFSNVKGNIVLITDKGYLLNYYDALQAGHPKQSLTQGDKISVDAIPYRDAAGNEIAALVPYFDKNGKMVEIPYTAADAIPYRDATGRNIDTIPYYEATGVNIQLPPYYLTTLDNSLGIYVNGANTGNVPKGKTFFITKVTSYWVSGQGTILRLWFSKSSYFRIISSSYTSGGYSTVFSLSILPPSTQGGGWKKNYTNASGTPKCEGLKLSADSIPYMSDTDFDAGVFYAEADGASSTGAPVTTPPPAMKMPPLFTKHRLIAATLGAAAGFGLAKYKKVKCLTCTAAYIGGFALGGFLLMYGIESMENKKATTIIL